LSPETKTKTYNCLKTVLKQDSLETCYPQFTVYKSSLLLNYYSTIMHPAVYVMT